MIEYRFSGKAGEEYKIFKLACPHFDELQCKLGEEIKRYATQNKKDAIKVLEIGCGTGYTTNVILSQDPRIHVVAIDNESVMLQQARHNLRDFVQAGRLELIESDALEYLELSHCHFDIVASAFTLHNFELDYRRKVLENVHKVIKDGGLFVNADKYARVDKQQEDLRWQIGQIYIAYSSINRPDLIKVWIEHYLEDNKTDKLMEESQSIQEMKSIGFGDMKINYREKMEAVITALK